MARRSSMSKIPSIRKSSPKSRFPEGVHSHKVRVSGDIMLVNLERYRAKKDRRRDLKIYDIANRDKAARDRFLSNQRRRASLYLRWPLRLPVGACRRLHRTYPDYFGLKDPGQAGRSRPLVDARTMDRRRREAYLGRHRTSVPSSDPLRRPALRQLLAWRFRDSRYRRHEQAASLSAASTGRRPILHRFTRRCQFRGSSRAAT